MSKLPDEILTPGPISKSLGLSDAAALLFRIKENILQGWESQCREKVLAAKFQSHPALLNEIPKFIDQLALTIGPDFKIDYEANSKVAHDHAEEQSDLSAYTLDQVIHEYQILRTTLIEFLEAETPLNPEVRKLIHEFIDQGIRKAAARYAEIELNNLEHSEAHLLEAVFAQSPGAMAVFEGPDHIFTMANTAYLSQFFGGRQDLIGKTVRTAVPEVVEQGFVKLLDDVYQTGEPFIGNEMPIDLRQPDGTLRKFHLNLVYHPLRNASGKITGIVAIITNVTGQVSAEIKLQEGDARLIKNQKLLSIAVRVAKVGFYNWDIQKDSIEFSDQMLNDWGIKSNCSLQEATARIHADDREKINLLIEKSMHDRTPFFAEYRVVRPDGRTIWIEAQGIVEYSNDGTPVFFYGTSIDITARKVVEFQLQLEKHKLETVFQDSPAAMAMWHGPELIFEKVNPTYQSIFEDRQLVGKSLLDAIPELKGQAFNDMLKKVFETGESIVGHEMLAKILLKKDGPLEDRYFDFTYVRVNDPDGNPCGVYNHGIDVTDRVVGRMQLHLAKNDAVKANQTKSSFLANMSHEIRTPLSAILGFTDLLKDRGLSYEDRDQFLEIISRNGKALTKIIDDILDLTKVESGKLDIENLEFSLFDLINDVIDIFREYARSKNIFLRAHFDKATPDRVISDPTRIRQILINVVGNAVKFTASGGVTIKVSANENIGNKTLFRILVKDTGVGLTSDQKENLFQPFMQADNSTTRKYGGTGLGLVLSQRLTNALGGNIFIEASEATQNGCTFGVTFVAEVSKEVTTKEKIKDDSLKNKEKDIQQLSGIHVLLVEDSPENQVLVRLVLIRQGATVDTAKNGAEAFKMGMAGTTLTLF
jgi:PAS domain S-box-containing protein